MSFNFVLLMFVLISGSHSSELNDHGGIWTNLIFQKLNTLLDYYYQLNTRLDDQEIFLKSLIDNENISSSKPEVDRHHWTIIQRRQHVTFNFNRSWSDYKHGFGDPKGDFFIGLEKLHEMTAKIPHELFIELQTTNNSMLQSNYNEFAIDSESKGYRIKAIGNFSGDIDSFPRSLIGKKFSTFDRNNVVNRNSIKIVSSGWWHISECDLNRFLEPNSTFSFIYCFGLSYGKRDYFRLKSSTMKIRPIYNN